MISMATEKVSTRAAHKRQTVLLTECMQQLYSVLNGNPPQKKDI